ncbi:CII-binding regulator of phage lambda lysogenization HflD [Pseudomonas sp. S3E17]|nr:CII-binding regulator of phage lambda lysogenization HflD [Pseudomonas sp. S3E17]
MTFSPNLDQMSSDQLRALAAKLLSQVETMDKKINRDQTVIEKLTHEIAQLKRFKFAKRSEQLNPEQASLLDDLIDTDIVAIEAELQALQAAPTQPEKKQKPKRAALPAEFPRTLIHHEPDNTHCPCGCALNARRR